MELALATKMQPTRFKFPTQAQVALSAPSILLVEDHPESQEAHLHLLRLMGCKVDLATTGQEAIKLSSHPYDLVLLDISLPDLCGYKVCKIIKERHHPKCVPIIALASHDKEIKRAGVDELVAKPIPPETLISILTRWLG